MRCRQILWSKAYSCIPKENEKKLDSKTFECILIGYNENVKGYRLYNPNTKSIIISRNVAFNEDTQDQECAPPPANDTFIELQPSLLDEDQTLTQGGHHPQHGQLQTNTPNIRGCPSSSTHCNSRLGFRFFGILQFRNGIFRSRRGSAQWSSTIHLIITPIHKRTASISKIGRLFGLQRRITFYSRYGTSNRQRGTKWSQCSWIVKAWKAMDSEYQA